MNRWGIALAGAALVSASVVVVACSNDDCTRTLTCEPPPTGGGGSSGTGEGGSGGGTGTKPLGDSCTDGAECASGFCADGVCCLDACDSACVQCNASGSEGECTATAEGEDPDEECHGEAVCGDDGCAYGEVLWSASYGQGDDQYGTAMTATPNDDLIVAGPFQTVLDLGGGQLSPGSAYAGMFNAAGVHLWSRTLSDNDSVSPAVAASRQGGSSALLGTFYGTADFGGGQLSTGMGVGVFVLKLDAVGNHTGSTGFFCSASVCGDPHDVELDETGNVYILATSGKLGISLGSNNDVPADTTFVTKLDGNLEVVWVETLTSNTFLHLAGLELMGSEVVVAGDFQGTLDVGTETLTAPGRDVFLSSFDTSGVYQSSAQYGDGEATADDLANTNDGWIVTGGFTSTITFGSEEFNVSGPAAYVAKVSKNDKTSVWAVAIDGDFVPERLSAQGDDVVVGGAAVGDVNLGDVTLGAGETQSLGVLKMTGDGTPIWARAVGPPATPSLGSLAALSNGTTVLFGNFTDTLSLGEDTLVSEGGEDLLLAALGP